MKDFRQSNLSHIISIVTLCALIISMFVSAYQAYETRHHDGLSMRPMLTFYYNTDDEPVVGLSLENDGLGPAILKSIVIYVNRVPVKDWDKAIDDGKINNDYVHETDFDKNDVLPAGRSEFVLSYLTKDRKGLKRFMEFVDKHLAVSINYCSINGECQTKYSSEGRC